MDNEILEKWLPVKEWEDIYEVSDLGRVRRLPFYGVTKSGKKTLLQRFNFKTRD